MDVIPQQLIDLLDHDHFIQARELALGIGLSPALLVYEQIRAFDDQVAVPAFIDELFTLLGIRPQYQGASASFDISTDLGGYIHLVEDFHLPPDRRFFGPDDDYKPLVLDDPTCFLVRCIAEYTDEVSVEGWLSYWRNAEQEG